MILVRMLFLTGLLLTVSACQQGEERPADETPAQDTLSNEAAAEQARVDSVMQAIHLAEVTMADNTFMGSIHNRSDYTVPAIDLHFILLDKDSTEVGTISTHVDRMAPGDSEYFTEKMSEAEAVGYRLDRIEIALED